MHFIDQVIFMKNHEFVKSFKCKYTYNKHNMHFKMHTDCMYDNI